MSLTSPQTLTLGLSACLLWVLAPAKIPLMASQVMSPDRFWSSLTAALRRWKPVLRVQEQPPAPPQDSHTHIHTHQHQISLTDVNSVDRYNFSLATQPGSGNPSPCLPKGWSSWTQTSPTSLTGCHERSHNPTKSMLTTPHCDSRRNKKQFVQRSLFPWQLFCTATFP